MNVVFFAVGEEHAALAELAAECVRLTNPSAKVWALTDPMTGFQTITPVRGHTSPQTMMIDRLIAQYHFLRQEGEALFLDSDCVVQRDLTDVFKGPVSVTERVPPKAAQGQPYNGGVLYGRGPEAVEFWAILREIMDFMQRDAWAWFGDQLALAHVVPHCGDIVNVYPCETHNYPPNVDELKWSSDDKMRDAFIVHFKGERRKAQMRQYVDQLKARHRGKNIHRLDQRAVSGDRVASV